MFPRKVVEEGLLEYGCVSPSLILVHIVQCIEPSNSCYYHPNCGLALKPDDLIVIRSNGLTYKVDSGKESCIVGKLSMQHLTKIERMALVDSLGQILCTYHYEVESLESEEAAVEAGRDRSKKLLATSFRLGGLSTARVLGKANATKFN